MKTIFLILILPFAFVKTYSQTEFFFTRTGYIWFFSEAPLENIKANNHSVNCIFNPQTGEFVVKLTISAFQFNKSLMQEHFNENYLESETFPKASLKGKINNYQKELLGQKKTLNLSITGNMEIHGISQKVEIPIQFIPKENEIKIKAKFQIEIKDFNIKIPSAVIKNIAEVVDVHVDLDLKKRTK